MPSDIVRAESMSDAELKSAANAADPVGSILYAARLLDQYNANVKVGAQFNQTEQLGLLVEIGRVMPQVLASGSPYAGYLYAAKARLMNPDNIELVAASQLAGLAWASKLGDTRANRLMDDPQVQAVDALLASVATNSMLSDALQGNAQVFAMPVAPIPAGTH